ncbi:MAG: hypothetical protein IPI33_10280 [Dehalococcoidia bacterium]|nr:hypothetical protein [Dehalococcoidia bacterium]
MNAPLEKPVAYTRAGSTQSCFVSVFRMSSVKRTSSIEFGSVAPADHPIGVPVPSGDTSTNPSRSLSGTRPEVISWSIPVPERPWKLRIRGMGFAVEAVVGMWTRYVRFIPPDRSV